MWDCLQCGHAGLACSEAVVAADCRNGRVGQGKAGQGGQGRGGRARPRPNAVCAALQGSILQLFPCVLYTSQTKKGCCAGDDASTSNEAWYRSIAQQDSKDGKSVVRQSAARCLKGRTDLERQSAAFCCQGAEAHWRAPLPSRQLSVQHILVQSCGIELQAKGSKCQEGDTFHVLIRKQP